ncbi:MAG: hypothetical protein M3525_01170 [Acidobacteriota bacterium]|nr:hypothetical protein [Acidobacteriota bacterium]
MTKAKAQNLKTDSGVFPLKNELSAPENIQTEDKITAVSTTRTESIEARDFSGVFARLKRSVRKKSVSIF